MKLVILAAGQGNRLRPLTDHCPKCMVPFRGRPIIDHILEAARPCGFDKTIIVTGYRGDVLRAHLAGQGVVFYENPRFETTNMVETLFAVAQELDDDVVISYADIVYLSGILKALVAEPSPFSVVVDDAWRKLWDLRMQDPLRDAETMKLDAQGMIRELGKKPKDYSEIQGQYMGLIKIRRSFWPEVKALYAKLDRQAVYDGKKFEMMFMTSFLQLIIDQLAPARAVKINGGWIEVDSTEDLAAYERIEPAVLGV